MTCIKLICHGITATARCRSKNRTAEFRDSRRDRREKEYNYDRRINYNEGGVEWAFCAISALPRCFKTFLLRLVPVL